MSQNYRYIESMDNYIGMIVGKYAALYPVWVERPINSNNENSSSRSSDSDSGGYVLVNISEEILENYHKEWKRTVGIADEESGGTPGFYCMQETDNYVATTLKNLWGNTLEAFSSEMILNKEDIEDGQFEKTKAIGELNDIPLIERALQKVIDIYNCKVPIPGSTNLEKIYGVIGLLRAIANEILSVIPKAKDVIASLEALHEKHMAINQAYAELVFFASSGDRVTYEYPNYKKAKVAINEYNPILSGTMDDIVASVPDIVEQQNLYLDIWDIVESIDPIEFREDKFKTDVYNTILALREDIKKQYLSGEIEDIGYRVSEIIEKLYILLNNDKTNPTYDKFIVLQQKLHLCALDGVNPPNIINRVSTPDWKDNIKRGYPELVKNITAKTKILKEA